MSDTLATDRTRRRDARNERYLRHGQTDQSLGRQIADVALRPPPGSRWLRALGASVLGALWLLVAFGYLFYEGVDIWGNNSPVMWALDIISYDWWMGIACGALAVSALLLLTGQSWRSGMNRSAETTAVLAAVAAGLYPIVHLGRPWFFFWNLPYPNSLNLWPQFRSPLVWDAFDILSFLLIAVLFWFVGMIPDFATLRDEAPTLGQRHAYGIAALGWRGSAIHWARYEQAYRLLGLLAVLQSVVVQCGASVMYAGTLEPGWHDPMLPVTFIVVSLLSGLGAIACVMAVLRMVFTMRDVIVTRHMDMVGRLMLGAAFALGYCYGFEFFFAAIAGDVHDRALLAQRISGPFAWSFWFGAVLAVASPQFLWLRAVRRNGTALGLIGMGVLAGTWCNHFMSLIATQGQDFLPSARHPFGATFWSVSTWAGSLGVFMMALLLAARFLPIASIVELRLLLRQDSVTR